MSANIDKEVLMLEDSNSAGKGGQIEEAQGLTYWSTLGLASSNFLRDGMCYTLQEELKRKQTGLKMDAASNWFVSLSGWQWLAAIFFS